MKIKKLSTLFAICAAITFATVLSASATDGKIKIPQSSGDMHFGVTAGLNLANIGDLPSGAGTPSMLIGFRLGATIDIPLADNLTFSPELVYSMKGAADKSTETFDLGSFGSVKITNDIKEHYNYLEIPLMVKYQLESGLNFSAGPYIGLLLSASAKGSVSSSTTLAGSTTTTSSDVDTSGTDGLNTTDFGIGFGAGYMLESGLGFGVRYSLGLSTIVKEYSYTDLSTGTPVTVTQPAYAKNNVISINFYYMLGMK